MKIDGQSSVWYDVFGQDAGKEATVKRESDDSNDLFGWNWNPWKSDKVSIDAGDGDDVIEVKKTGDDEYTVTVNGEKYQLTAEEMKNLTIDGGAGNDRIKIDASVDVAITVKGGDGDDKIANAANGTIIDGGEGRDQIANKADYCEIYGGGGDDQISSKGRGNRLDGGFRSIWDMLRDLSHDAGNDQIKSAE